jgi:Tol biopolymer transport system component
MPDAPSPRRTIVYGGAAIVALVVAAVAFWWWRSSVAPVARLSLTLPEGQRFAAERPRRLIAISPDGTELAYVAESGLYTKSLSGPAARSLVAGDPSTIVQHPVFSPDGRSIAYIESRGTSFAIQKIPVDGGTGVTLSRGDSFSGLSWTTDDIVFADRAGIWKVPTNAGTPQLVVRAAAGELFQSPQILPAGGAVLFTVVKGTDADRWDRAQVVAQSPASTDRKVVVEGGSDAVYTPTGHIVYAVRGVLFAVPFDVDRLQQRGDAAPVVEGVRRAEGDTGIAQFSVSATGTLVYLPVSRDAAATELALVLMDAHGAAQPLELPARSYRSPRISPDGRQIAVGVEEGAGASIWIHDIANASSLRRLTPDGRHRFPVWSDDSLRIVFQSDREGDHGLFWQAADGSGAAERLTRPGSGEAHIPEAFSSDGRRLLFTSEEAAGFSLWTLWLSDRTVAPFDEVESAALINASFSPDGKWVAYDTSPRKGEQPPPRTSSDVYVQPFPTTGAKYLISANGGGHHPVWGPHGSELYYVAGTTGFAMTTVKTTPAFAVGPSVPVARPGWVESGAGSPRNNDVARDGRQVAVIRSASSGPIPPSIAVVVNWFKELNRLAPSRR